MGVGRAATASVAIRLAELQSPHIVCRGDGLISEVERLGSVSDCNCADRILLIRCLISVENNGGLEPTL